MKANEKQEAGQVLVILALVLVGLLGFAALVVDGGTIFADRRFDQSAADASAVAGAVAAAQSIENQWVENETFTCTNPKVITAMNAAAAAAINRSADNNFTITSQASQADLDASKHGVYVQCGVVIKDGYNQGYIDVMVDISSDVNTAFAHLFYPNDIRNSVEAVARVEPRTSGAFGYAIAALKDSCQPQDPLILSGSAQITIKDSGVFSNSCLTAGGNVKVLAATQGIRYVSTYTNPGGAATIVPDPKPAPEPLPEFDYPAPDAACAKLPDRGSVTVNNADNVILEPGRYSKIRVQGGTATLNTGLYCLSGDFTINGGDVSCKDCTDPDVAPIENTGVTIYLTGTKTNFTTSGNPTVVLQATSSKSSEWYGMLIYLAHNNTGTVTLIGNSVSTYYGTIYAPDGDIVLNGTSNNESFYTQIIGNTVTVNGNNNTTIQFPSKLHYSYPSFIDMYE